MKKETRKELKTAAEDVKAQARELKTLLNNLAGWLDYYTEKTSDAVNCTDELTQEVYGFMKWINEAADYLKEDLATLESIKEDNGINEVEPEELN